MTEFGAPAVFAVLVWWFTTGILLFLDGLPRSTFRWSMTAMSLVTAVAAYELHLSSSDTTVSGAYVGFGCAILVWAWLEMSFLMGFVTGPRKVACHDRCAGWLHFLHATQAIIYNEVATLLGGLGVLAATWHAPNRTGLWTFLVLWAMRLSAKLNLFLGVPNLGEKFLPPHLLYLKSFFSKRPMNFLFPLSISGATAGTLILAQLYLRATDPGSKTGYALVASLLGLALLEHWFMVLPLPSEKLWNWAFKAAGTPRKTNTLNRSIVAKSG